MNESEMYLRLVTASQKVVEEFNSRMDVKIDSPLGEAIVELDRATDAIVEDRKD